MIEVIYQIIDLIIQFINSIFNFKIDFIDGESVPIGIIIVAFVFFVLVIYLILKAIGISGKDDE